jgi:hypothetical protein
MAKTLGWDGVGPSQMETLAKAGYTSVPKIRALSLADLQKLLGQVKGKNLHALIQEDGWTGATEIELYLASPVCQVGIGKGRMEALAKAQADVRAWHAMAPPAGWTKESLAEFLKGWSAYETFRRTQWSFIHYPQPLLRTTIVAPIAQVPKKGSVVFTGFRDDDLQAKLEARGYTLTDSVKADCKAVLIADTKDPETFSSSKTEKAKKIPGCKILKRSAWESL